MFIFILFLIIEANEIEGTGDAPSNNNRRDSNASSSRKMLLGDNEDAEEIYRSTVSFFFIIIFVRCAYVTKNLGYTKNIKLLPLKKLSLEQKANTIAVYI